MLTEGRWCRLIVTPAATCVCRRANDVSFFFLYFILNSETGPVPNQDCLILPSHSALLIGWFLGIIVTSGPKTSSKPDSPVNLFFGISLCKDCSHQKVKIPEISIFKNRQKLLLSLKMYFGTKTERIFVAYKNIKLRPIQNLDRSVYIFVLCYGIKGL